MRQDRVVGEGIHSRTGAPAMRMMGDPADIDLVIGSLLSGTEHDAGRDVVAAAIITNQRAALLRILQWCEAYPKTVFREPDYDKAHAALEAAGVSMDGLHGSWAWHLLEGIRGYAQRGVEGLPCE
jgi:hypothetical protein